jgi:hypothetical protein
MTKPPPYGRGSNTDQKLFQELRVLKKRKPKYYASRI